MHDCDCDHIIGLSTVPDCGGLVHQIEITSEEFANATRELFAFADKFLTPEARRHVDELPEMTGAAIYERYLVRFSYCPNCGEKLIPDTAAEVRPMFIKPDGTFPLPAIICRCSAGQRDEDDE